MNTNPMMIYFGQEFGELGMDSEGFSGRDGRTTIFDYWSVDTIRRWRNGGKFDGKMLTEDQKHLYSIYKRLLTLCNEEKAISQGAFFDLMYANVNGWRFNEHKQYTFLRKFERVAKKPYSASSNKRIANSLSKIRSFRLISLNIGLIYL